MPVSIHAPIWGATLPGRLYISDTHIVSIHAPVWGATGTIISTYRPNASFNPRARMGRDKCCYIAGRSSTMFQSTRPYGARPVNRCKTIFELVFQSTRPYGARPRGRPNFVDVMVFQSTRPYGARLVNRVLPLGFTGFNPRARMGRDSYQRNLNLEGDMFQSTRPYGARP